MEHLVGKSLDRYELLQLMGQGGMGAVFKARDITLQRDVALKIMHSHFASQPDFRERFLQEARTAAKLDHPGIVQVYDFGQVQGQLYIVMKFISGSSLGKMLSDLREKGQWIGLDEAVSLVSQVAQALHYVHAAGVLHRDIKPGNIMIEPVLARPESGSHLPYRAVITDLGLAKLAEGGVMTQDGASMGTPAYMSPEQALGKTADARSDIYSLGVLLFELSTARLPFPVKTITDAIRFHTQEPPPAPTSLRPDLPPALEAIILKAMQKDPALRFNDANDFAAALDRLSLPAADQTMAGTPGLADTVNLITVYQQDLENMRGVSILREFKSAGPDSQDRIQVMVQGVVTQTVIIPAGGLTIGRGAENQIVLNDRQASRNHARIEFTGRDYRIQDLNSTNGTFLGTNRLLPGVPEIWDPEQPLRIGDCYLRLLRAHRAAAAPAASVLRMTLANGSVVDPGRIKSSSGQGRLGVVIEDAQLSVEPGGSVTVPVYLLNQGDLVDHFKIQLTGVPDNWITSRPAKVNLMPGEQGIITLTIQPPRDPHSRAGRYSLNVRALSESAPDQVVETRLTLTVTPFTHFTSELAPQRVYGGSAARVTVRNLGNVQESFVISLKDRSAEVNFTPPQEILKVESGAEATSEFRLGPRTRRWLGGEKNFPFTAQVAHPKGEVQAHPGEMVSRGLIPSWVPGALVVLCLGLAAVLAFLWNNLNSQANRTTQTAVAQILNLTAQAENLLQSDQATARALLNANQATRDAATVTATWLDADDDRDGLSNRDELQQNTLPNNRDTDLDGLSDGDELRRGTNPLDDDSDDDGLKDGREIEVGANPMLSDTDGDGILDGPDPVPLQVSTATPDLNATQAAIATQTAAAQAAIASQTAAAQAAFASQTAAAKNATAQVIAQQTEAAKKATNQALSATQTALASRRIVYIYLDDTSHTKNFTALLERSGARVDNVSMGQITSTDFSKYDLVVIGHETGYLSSWGESGSQVSAIANTFVPVIGIGEGGYAFLGKLGLLVGSPNGAHGTCSQVRVYDSHSPYWSAPNKISIPGDGLVTLYSNNGECVVIYMPDIVMGFDYIGQQPSDSRYYPLLLQDRYLLWGFDTGPKNMTKEGENLFLNLVERLLLFN